MDEVMVTVVELNDLGAQSRGHRVFGVVVGGDRHLSFETTPDDYDASVTFCLIGVMEGLRYAEANPVLVMPHGLELRFDPELDGGMVLNEGEWGVTYADWAAAMVQVAALERVDSRTAG